MNLQRGDKGIGWCDATWNPVTGCLSTKEQCAVRDVCYARRTARKLAGRFGYPEYPNHFKPTFHPERLEEPYKLKKPSKIFVCSMGELFGPWVPNIWQMKVFGVIKKNARHTFQLLTKFPRYYRYWHRWPDNAWLGATINSNADQERWGDLLEANAEVLYISAEPLLGSLDDLDLFDLDWLIIGAQTNPDKQPRAEWVEELLKQADEYGFPVFMKSNLDYEPKRREFPRGGGDG